MKNPSDKLHVRRLLNVISNALGSIPKSRLFEPNVGSNVNSLFEPVGEKELESAKRITQDYLEAIKSRKGIYDHTVETRLDTWEIEYPFMPIRLLAIEALEKFGETIQPENFTEEMQAYPYEYVRSWRVQGIALDGTGNEYTWTEWEYEEPLPQEGQIVTEFGHWEIRNPEYKVLANIAFRPTQPVKYIKLKTVITRHDFAGSLNEF